MRDKLAIARKKARIVREVAINFSFLFACVAKQLQTIRSQNTEKKVRIVREKAFFFKAALIFCMRLFNVHLVSKTGPVISNNFHHVRYFTWSSIYHREPLFTDKLCKSRLIMNVVLPSLSVNNLTRCALNIACDIIVQPYLFWGGGGVD